MSVYLLVLLLGVFTGLRTMSAPTAVSIAARLGWLDLAGTPLAFLGSAWTPWVLVVFAIGELIADQLPTTPRRTVPMQFGARLFAGLLSGAAVGAAYGMLAGGLVVGAIGAVIGTLGGYRARMGLARSFGNDRPAAFLEDVVAYAGVALAVSLLP